VESENEKAKQEKENSEMAKQADLEIEEVRHL
jgi:hypothetical protein